MEPRPPKSTRPVSSPNYVASPPPVPSSERLAAQRPSWLDQPSGSASGAWDVDGDSPDEQTPQSIDQSAWYDANGHPVPEVEPGGIRSPLMPVVSPRGERRNRILGPLLALILLAIVAGGGYFAYGKIRDGNDGRNSADATRAAQVPAPTATTAAAAQSNSAVASPTEQQEAAQQTGQTAPANTVEPTKQDAAAAQPTATEANAAAADAPRTSNAKEASIFLPEVADLPDGFQQSDAGAMSKSQVADAIGDNGNDLLAQWEWRENASRSFEIPASSNPDPNGTASITVSVHRFRNADGATAALDGLADVLASTAGYKEVDVGQIGEQTRALTSESPNSHLYALYVRTANIVIRIGGFSAEGDSSADVIALAKKLVAR